MSVNNAMHRKIVGKYNIKSTMSSLVSSKHGKRKYVKEKRHNSEQEETTKETVEHILCSPISTMRSPCSYNMDNRGTCCGSDIESEPDRSNPAWKILSDSDFELREEKLEEIIEPEETKKGKTLWEEIMEEYESERTILRHMNEERKPFEPEIPIRSTLTAVQYLEHYIFPVLYPALEDTLFQAKKEECLQIQKCVFNGLDHISEVLWNTNPMHPKRIARGYTSIFHIPFVKLWLYDHPRPIYPLSWIWTQNQAITVMQAYIRRYLVCREPDCSEMRKFWQIFRQEKKDEECFRQLEHYEEVKEIVDDILKEIIAVAVYKAEWKIHGCFCISKPCHCVCKCFKWCKCCKCYKQEKSVTGQFYSYISQKNSSSTRASEVSKP